MTVPTKDHLRLVGDQESDPLAYEPPTTGLDAGDHERHHVEDAPESTGVPIDPTEGPRERPELRPVLPTWAANWDAFKASATFGVKVAANRAAYELFRSPATAARLAWYATRGAGKVSWLATRWLTDQDSGSMARHSLQKREVKEFITLARLQGTRVVTRLLAVAFIAAPFLVSWLTLRVLGALNHYPSWAHAPAWAPWLASLLVTALLIAIGKPKDRPLIGPAVIKRGPVRLTSAVIGAAMASIGITGLRKDYEAGISNRWFTTPISRVKTGFLAELELPLGVTSTEVAEKRAKLASGLRRPLGSVWPEPAPNVHEGALRLYVLDQPLSQMVQPTWPLAKAGRADVFKPLPYGYDPKGDEVSLTLIYSNLLIGAIPRQGKSFSFRVCALGMALDPTVELHMHELKGTGDFSSIEEACHRYTSGPARDEDLAKVMASIREVHSYLEPRALTIAKLGPARCPEKKVTRELANDRSLGLHPVFLGIDEVQEMFESEYAKEAEHLLRAIIKRGPALAIMLVLATQRPDAKSLPTSIASNMGLRLCLRVADQLANDMVLGTSAYKIGINATLLGDDDKGIGLLRDGGPTARTVRAAYLDAEASNRIGARALDLRRQLGYLTGDAIGESVETPMDRMQVVLDCIDAWAASLPPGTGAEGDTAIHVDRLQATLAEHWPGRYGDLTGRWLGGRLRALKVPVLPQLGRRIREDGATVNRAGVELAALQEALDNSER
jgi:S-DNA-T family DNA segregation ATPase FtsK/SpoIIIE